MSIDRVTVLWSGFPGAPGYTRFYTDPSVGVPPLADYQAFFTGIADRIPSSVTIQVQSTGDTLDEQTGAITGSWSEAAQTAIVGTGSGAYAAASGAHINWRTATLVNGRRLKGRTFLVPLYGGAYDSDGTIAATVLTDLRTNLATLVAAVGGGLQVVWHRPVNGANGSIGDMTSADIPDKAAVLRSRRD
jgi:hypothetical protein